VAPLLHGAVPGGAVVPSPLGAPVIVQAPAADRCLFPLMMGGISCLAHNPIIYYECVCSENTLCECCLFSSNMIVYDSRASAGVSLEETAGPVLR
jgi:hypothetical protein